METSLFKEDTTQLELAGLGVDRSLSRDIDLGTIRHDGVRVWTSWLGAFFGKNLSPWATWTEPAVL